ncbi:MAG: hypothetical protein U0M42_03355 [Acutalibacteraceae bacterium]|nr:hypothetical protein [Acutalibacteraceae bacterium]
MEEKKRQSDTLAQRDKARKDFLELKRMQLENSEIKEEKVAYSGEIKPITFMEKLSHFWYYYKIPVIAVAVAVVFVVFMCAQCMNREKSDVKIAIYDSNIVPDMYMGAIEDYFEQFCQDYNGDGKVVVTVMNCSYQAGGSSAQYQLTMQQKLQSIIVGDKETMLFITSQSGYDYLNSLTDINLLSQENIPLDEDFYKAVTLQEDIKMPQGLSLYYRNIEGTLIENDETAVESSENCKSFFMAMSGEKQ